MLLLPLVTAEEESYSEYNSLDLYFSEESGINLTYQKADSKISYFTASSVYFPKDDLRQSVLNYELSSEPEASVTFDNNLLSYRWEDVDKENLKFGYKGNIRVKNEISKVTKKNKFPILELEDEYFMYTQETTNIDITSEITKKAAKLIEGKTDLYDVVFELADWTKKNVKYKSTTLTAQSVQKSSWVLENKEGVCDEITNLFISLCRSQGIPARFVGGVVYSNIEKKWGSHGWAEVYFPDYGWVPFDVTFGQFGWLDPSHIKLKESFDSGESSVEYNWRSSGVEVNTKGLDIEAELLSKGSKMDGVLSLDITLFGDEVGFGSYIPIQVTVKNLKPYYVSSIVYIMEAPELLGENTEEVLLEPGETKNIYWITHIPDNVSKEYVYTSKVSVKDSFGSLDSSELTYAEKYDVYSLEKAEREVETLTEREEKKVFDELDLKCSLGKEYYYSNESVDINCYLKNKGSETLNDLNICSKEQCEKVSLNSLEEKNVELKLFLSSSGRLIVLVEDEGRIRYDYLDVDIVQIPTLRVSGVKPASVNYGDKVELLFTLNCDYNCKGIEIDVNKLGVIKVDEIKQGDKEVSLTLMGKYLMGGLVLDMRYKDEKGNEYNRKQDFSIKVENIPWYGWILNWLINFFNKI